MKALQFPLTRITLWFILGILYAASIEPNVVLAFVLLGVAAIGFGIAYFFTAKNFTPTLYFGVASYFLSFCIGITTLLAHTDLYYPKNYFHQLTNPKQEHILEVVLREKLKAGYEVVYADQIIPGMQDGVVLLCRENVDGVFPGVVAIDLISELSTDAVFAGDLISEKSLVQA